MTIDVEVLSCSGRGQRQFTLSLEEGTIRRMNVWHHLAEQFCQPTGFAGRFVGFLFRMNREGVGWTSHVAWDLAVSPETAASHVPAWWPALCVGTDLFLAGYITAVIWRR